MSEAFATSKVVTTELGRINQLAGSVGVTSLPVYMGATLNSKYDVLKSVTPTEIPKIRYFGIGIKGFANVSTEKNIAQPYQPKSTNMDLYEPIPFRCVKTPLDKETAAQYRMVTTKVINGETYFLYYLKLLDFSAGIQFTRLSTDGVSSTNTLNTANLFPSPSAINGSDVDSDTSRSVASITATRIITGAEVVEAINILYNGDLRRARISEFGLYSGVEARSSRSGIDYEYDEAAYVQLASHQCCIGYDCSNVNTRIEERCVISGGELINI